MDKMVTLKLSHKTNKQKKNQKIKNQRKEIKNCCLLLTTLPYPSFSTPLPPPQNQPPASPHTAGTTFSTTRNWIGGCLATENWIFPK